MKRIFILLGASGAGKTYAVGGALKKLGIPELVSHTTRSPRVGEIEGVNYYYVSKAEFDQLEKIEFTEYPPQSGKFYCVSKKEVEEKLREYDTVFAVTDIKGVRQFREQFPKETKVIYVSIPSQLMAERMRTRGDSEADIQTRLENAEKSGELKNYIYADYIVENISLEQTYERVKKIITLKDDSFEIERKFLVNYIPSKLLRKNQLCLPKKELVQGYLSFNPEVRIRQEDDDYYKTVKQGTGLVRKEVENVISKAEFDFLSNNVVGNFIRKIRYYLLMGNQIAELNVYQGKLEGLITVEVEFISEEEANDFILPDWFGEEITNNNNYLNQQLALK